MFSPTTQEIKKFIFLTTPDFGELNRRRSLNNFRPHAARFFQRGPLRDLENLRAAPTYCSGTTQTLDSA
jgi:hypothetical protein